MKGIGFTFDAFGQWSDHERNKMEWRMKVGIEWRPSMAGRSKIGGRPASFSLLASFPLHYLPLSSTTTPLGQNGAALATWAGRLATILAGRPPLGSPIKGLSRGASSFIPQAHKQPQIP
jgi:hypothetical protein